MPPTAPIDHVFSPTKQFIYVLEAAAVWKAENIGQAGVPTWEQIGTAEAGDTFHRIIAPTFNTVCVLATRAGAVTNDAYLYKTISQGLTWTIKPIAENIGLGAAYTVNVGTDEISHSIGGPRVYAATQHARLGDAESTNNPWGVAFNWEGNLNVAHSGSNALNEHPDDTIIEETQGSGTAPNGLPYCAINDAIAVGERAVVEGWFTAKFGGVEDVAWRDFNPALATMPKEANRTWLNFTNDDGAGTSTITSWVFWHQQQQVAATALAAAPSNGSWYYVGFQNSIVKTEDGGDTWQVLTEAYGAYDIAVNPLAAGVITFWSTAGELRQMIAGQVQAALLTETAIQQAHRISYAPDNGGTIWVLQNNGASFTLQAYGMGSWTPLQSGIVGAAGLNVYRKSLGVYYVLYLSGSLIYYSEDGGVTVSDSTWAGYGSPVWISLL